MQTKSKRASISGAVHRASVVVRPCLLPLLSAVRRLRFAACFLLSAVCCPLSAVSYMLFLLCLLSVVCCLRSALFFLPSAVSHLLVHAFYFHRRGARRMLSAVCYMLPSLFSLFIAVCHLPVHIFVVHCRGAHRMLLRAPGTAGGVRTRRTETPTMTCR